MAFKEIPTVNYPNVLQTLEDRLPKSAMMHNVLKMIMMERKMHPPSVSTKFYSFNDPNSKNAFIVAILYRKVFNDYAIEVSPPEKITPEMISAFDSLVDWELSICFCAVDIVFSKTIAEMCQKHGCLGDVDPCDFMAMTSSKAAAIEFSVPPNVEVTELRPTDADLVTKRWQFSSPGTEILMKEMIENTGSAGVFVKGLNDELELVSWVVIFVMGSVNALFTEEEHRGKGYGALTMMKACQLMGPKGLVPNVQVNPGNEPSKKLMRNVGFEYSHRIEWVVYRPSKTS